MSLSFIVFRYCTADENDGSVATNFLIAAQSISVALS